MKNQDLQVYFVCGRQFKKRIKEKLNKTKQKKAPGGVKTVVLIFVRENT